MPEYCVPFEHPRNLSFVANSIELVITSEVLERIINPRTRSRTSRGAHGQSHIFTLATDWPLPKKGWTTSTSLTNA